MKKVKAVNGYTIYEATKRDENKYNVTEGYFYIYFSSDIRDYGLAYSYMEWEAGSIEEAEELCKGSNYAIAREIVEERTTAATYEEIEEVEALLNAGLSAEEIEEVEERKEEKKMKLAGTYFYGNEASNYAKENGYLDYATLAKAFDAVLNNDIMQKTYDIGYWEQESGFIDNSEEIEELNDRISELMLDNEEDEHTEEIDELQERIDELEDEQNGYEEIFQYFIVSDNGARILKECNEIVFYNEELDMYIWGVTHWGTSWDYVLTDIKLNCGEEAYR